MGFAGCCATVTAMSAVGSRVRAVTADPDGHTRLPRYVRGHQGEIVDDHGSWPLPDEEVRGQPRANHARNLGAARLAGMTARAMGNSIPGTDHWPAAWRGHDILGGFWMKSKGSKPARWRSTLVAIAALTAVALSAERVARMRRRGRSS